MLNSKKLLYVFSDVAYVVELLPAKKKGDFKIQEFRQINGEFLDDDTFIADNIEKLFSKLDQEEYLLVLPDFFFTNTIIEVGEKAKTKVEKHIKEKLLPTLNLTEETHQIEHFVLTQYGDKSNVQLSAIEKALLAPIFASAKKHEVKVIKTVSLSWTIKVLISLEPSLSLLQMGENLYLVQHYIGIDQATTAEVSDVEKIGETIKTLKGAEPSIQTVYLLTNELVEKKLKKILKATLPLQQLADFKDDKSEVPSYVKQAIEAGAKTLSVTDFNVPEFKVEEVDEALIKEAKNKPTKVDKNEEKDEETVDPKSENTQDDNEKVITEENHEEPLPEPTTPPPSDNVITPIEPVEENAEKTNDENVDEQLEEKTEKKEEETKKEELDDSGVNDDFEVVGALTAKLNTDNDILEEKSKETDISTPTMPKQTKNTPTSEEVTTEAREEKKEPDALSQFAVVEESPQEKTKETKTMKEEKTNKKEVIKNKTGVSSMLKMVFVSLSVFFLTVGIGVGLGLGYLTISNQQPVEENPQVADETVAQEEVSPTPSPSPSPEVEIDKAEFEVLVVNATTKAGYAGEIKGLIEEDEFENVSAGNAKGDYDEGNYVLMKEENEALIEMFAEATELEFEYSDEIKTEDIKGVYDAVIVLAE